MEPLHPRLHLFDFCRNLLLTRPIRGTQLFQQLRATRGTTMDLRIFNDIDSSTLPIALISNECEKNHIEKWRADRIHQPLWFQAPAVNPLDPIHTARNSIVSEQRGGVLPMQTTNHFALASLLFCHYEPPRTKGGAARNLLFPPATASKRKGPLSRVSLVNS